MNEELETGTLFFNEKYYVRRSTRRTSIVIGIILISLSFFIEYHYSLYTSITGFMLVFSNSVLYGLSFWCDIQYKVEDGQPKYYY